MEWVRLYGLQLHKGKVLLSYSERKRERAILAGQNIRLVL